MVVVGKLVFSVIPALLVLWGLVTVYRTYEGRAHADDIGERAATVETIDPGDGPVELQGTARATSDETVPAAMCDTEGVVVRTVVEERSGDAVGDARKTAWDTVYADGEFAPFALDDGTGHIGIEPPDGNVAGFTVDTESYESEPGEEPPAPVRRWLAATDGIDAAVDQYRGYRQGVIEDGESIYARGAPVRTDGGGTVLTGGDGPEEFVVSDLDTSELAEAASYGAWSYVFGVVLVILGALPLAYLWTA